MDSPHWFTVSSRRSAMVRPTSVPGPAKGAPDRWWRRPLARGSFGGAEYGVDFGDQRHQPCGVIQVQGGQHL
ncbi:hypothetical protein BKG86_16860 [Mycobacteroides chelonae]|nr:hypothetical protein BKG86_16860 [Mycobacteroides chelonae]